MKIGTLCFSTDQGLGILAKDFYDEGIITDVAVIRHGRRPEHDEWYPNSPRIGNLNDPALLAFCLAMDVILFFETPFNWSLIAACRDAGVKTFLCPMYECMPDPLPAHPDHFICPSLLDLQCYPDGHWQTHKVGKDQLGNRILIPVSTRSVFLPVPVPRAVASRWRLRETAEVFVHNAGHGGLRGRNGTAELYAAMQYVKSGAKLIVRTQAEGEGSGHRGRNLHWRSGTVPYEDLYSEGDVFIFPERFNGLSLPLQEAHASGMLVMATDRFPINAWLPTEPLVKPSGYQKARVATRCREFDEAIIDPKDIASKIDEWYGRDISEYSRQGRQWAEENSWDALKPKYLEVLGQ